ncbi:MAG: hypothetical protein BJ554DRAFT_2473 [Olpidium bornovanus]|uniref:Uncharacterized protein n=1 Tax=Olpidium bornovanus TaxID=278681 RepID=A0A8H8DMJ3_9FUNG|nr:MAG: hypothetical protein BJ554DRAFT_2473 [Olpidium bornovanus]
MRLAARLFHRRWNKNSKKATIMADGNHVKWETVSNCQPCRRNGGIGRGRIRQLDSRRIQVGGRTSAFVPAVQKLHDGNGSATRAVKRLSDNDSLGGTAKRDQLTKNGKSRKRGRANAEGDDDPAKTPEPPRKKRAASGRRARV